MSLRFLPVTSHQRVAADELAEAPGADPVKVGLVDNLSRPTGNLTGMSVFFSVLGPKRVELLHELLPAAALARPFSISFSDSQTLAGKRLDGAGSRAQL